MSWKSMDQLFRINKKYWQKNQGQGAHTRSTRVGARLPPGRAPCLVGPLELHGPQLQLHIFVFGEKNQREGFIMFYDTEPPPGPKLSREG